MLIFRDIFGVRIKKIFLLPQTFLLFTEALKVIL